MADPSSPEFKRSLFRGYRRNDVDVATHHSLLRIAQLEHDLGGAQARASAMQVEIRELHARIDALREAETTLRRTLEGLDDQREQREREAQTRANSLLLDAEERSAKLKTEGLRQVGELQRQVEQLLGMRAGLTHALQRLSEDLAAAMARLASAPAAAIDAPIEQHVADWSRDNT